MPIFFGKCLSNSFIQTHFPIHFINFDLRLVSFTFYVLWIKSISTCYFFTWCTFVVFCYFFLFRSIHSFLTIISIRTLFIAKWIVFFKKKRIATQQCTWSLWLKEHWSIVLWWQQRLLKELCSTRIFFFNTLFSILWDSMKWFNIFPNSFCVVNFFFW